MASFGTLVAALLNGMHDSRAFWNLFKDDPAIEMTRGLVKLLEQTPRGSSIILAPDGAVMSMKCRVIVVGYT